MQQRMRSGACVQKAYSLGAKRRHNYGERATCMEQNERCFICRVATGQSLQSFYVSYLILHSKFQQTALT